MGLFKKRKRGKVITADPKNFKDSVCSVCHQPIKIIGESDAIIYFTSHVERAKVSGLNGYCSGCRKSFCSEHANWQEGIKGMNYNPYCPICNRPLGGIN